MIVQGKLLYKTFICIEFQFSGEFSAQHKKIMRLKESIRGVYFGCYLFIDHYHAVIGVNTLITGTGDKQRNISAVHSGCHEMT